MTIERRVLFSETLPHHQLAAEFDLVILRAALAGLMERAAHAVQVAGFEQDDAVIDRLLVCHLGEGPSPAPSRVRLRDGAPCLSTVEVSADWMSDRERMIQHIVRQVSGRIGSAVAVSEVRIVAVRVTATLERWS